MRRSLQMLLDHGAVEPTCVQGVVSAEMANIGDGIITTLQ